MGRRAGSRFELVEMTADASDQAACRGAHLGVGQALGLDPEIGASGRRVELGRERVDEDRKKGAEVAIDPVPLGLFEELRAAIVDLDPVIVDDRRAELLENCLLYTSPSPRD